MSKFKKIVAATLILCSLAGHSTRAGLFKSADDFTANILRRILSEYPLYHPKPSDYVAPEVLLYSLKVLHSGYIAPRVASLLLSADERKNNDLCNYNGVPHTDADIVNEIKALLKLAQIYESVFKKQQEDLKKLQELYPQTSDTLKAEKPAQDQQ